MSWIVPVPPKAKLAGPEGLGAYVTELIVAGHPAEALRVWKAPIVGGRYNGMSGGEMLVKVAMEGMPTPGARGGSANWAVAAAAAWAMMVINGIIGRDARPFVLLDRYAAWCLGAAADGAPSRGLWSSETLSDVYGWTLHLLAMLTRDLGEQRVSGWRDQWHTITSVHLSLSRLLETHLWLLEKLTVSGHARKVENAPKARILRDHDPLVWAPGERSPPWHHNGALLTGWLRWVTGLPDRERGKPSDKSWSSWPFRLCRLPPPELQAKNHGAALASTLEVRRVPNADYSARLIHTVNGNTAPTAAVSFVGGKLYSLDVGQRDRRVGAVRTQHPAERWISGLSNDGNRGAIPAPRRDELPVWHFWHIGPDGFAEGPAS